MTTPSARAADYTIDELLAVCIARQVQDGETLAHGLATPLVAAGYILAQRTHAPNAYFASAIGQGLVQDWAPLGITTAEALWLGKAITNMSFVPLVADAMRAMAPKEFFRPAQVDPVGNFNNIALGKNLQAPRLRLPGSAGIPDVTIHSDHVYMYVPRHSRVIFVPELDWRSGMGHHDARLEGSGVHYLVSDLGQFDWVNGRMRLTTYHASVDIKRIQAKTGFELEIAPDVHETPTPTEEDIRLLREEIDPFAVRRLETLAGNARRDLLRAILDQEGEFEPANHQ